MLSVWQFASGAAGWIRAGHQGADSVGLAGLTNGKLSAKTRRFTANVALVDCDAVQAPWPRIPAAHGGRPRPQGLLIVGADSLPRMPRRP